MKVHDISHQYQVHLILGEKCPILVEGSKEEVNEDLYIPFNGFNHHTNTAAATQQLEPHEYSTVHSLFHQGYLHLQPIPTQPLNTSTTITTNQHLQNQVHQILYQLGRLYVGKPVYPYEIQPETSGDETGTHTIYIV